MKVFLSLFLSSMSFAACAQTLHDPVPLIGNQAQAIAGNAAMAGAFNHAAGVRSTRTPAQSAARLRDLEWSKSCRAQARTKPPGAMRRVSYKQCDTEFAARREFWK